MTWRDLRDLMVMTAVAAFTFTFVTFVVSGFFVWLVL